MKADPLAGYEVNTGDSLGMEDVYFLIPPSSLLIFDTSQEASAILKILNAQGAERLALNLDRGRHM